MRWLNAKLTSLLPLPYADNLIERRTEKLVRLTSSNRVLADYKLLKNFFCTLSSLYFYNCFSMLILSNANLEVIKMTHT